MESKDGFTCLLVEDDPAFAAMTGRVVASVGGKPTHCPTLAAALEATAARSFDLVLLDNHLPDGKAYDFYSRLSRSQPDAPIIMITGLPDLGEAVALTRNGLFDYLQKPVSVEQLTACLERARLRLRRRGAPGGSAAEVFGGQSPALREMGRQLSEAARHPGATVLLTGESGVGKDVATRTLHRLTFGSRAGEVPYVAVNCAALPADMFEAELFGAERGAYTGADRRRTGLVEAAQGGTLFLDEIGEVPLPLQAKLLRFIEGAEYRPLGATENRPFTGRLVAATNKDLRSEVEAGRFRADLLYRIEVFTVRIPPLRERRDEIPGLTERLLAGLAAKYGRRLPMVSADDLRALQEHDFPGNVRELRNILERSLLRTPEEGAWLALDRNWIQRRPAAEDVTPAVRAPAVSIDDSLPPERASLAPIEAQEYRLIRRTLREARGGIRRAAAVLGLSPQALLRRLEKWPELRPPAA